MDLQRKLIRSSIFQRYNGQRELYNQSLCQGTRAGKLTSADHNALLSVQQNYLLLGPMNSKDFL